MTLSKNDITMLCHYVERHYAECLVLFDCFAECICSKCRYAECRPVEYRGACALGYATSSTVVEHSTYDPKVEGSDPAPGKGKE